MQKGLRWPVTWRYLQNSVERIPRIVPPTGPIGRETSAVSNSQQFLLSAQPFPLPHECEHRLWRGLSDHRQSINLPHGKFAVKPGRSGFRNQNAASIDLVDRLE